MNTKLSALSLTISLLLSGCFGGSDSISHNPPSSPVVKPAEPAKPEAPKPEAPKPAEPAKPEAPKPEAPKLEAPKESIDVVGTPRPNAPTLTESTKPTLGSAIKIPMRNVHPQATIKEPKAKLGDVIALNDGTLAIPFEQELKQASTSSEKNITHSHDNHKNEHKRELAYVRSGYIQDLESGSIKDLPNKIWRKGAIGYVYYRGINPATNLPNAKSVIYKGTWDFVTDAKEERKEVDGFNQNDVVGAHAGNHYGATSMQESKQIELGVDSAEKPYAIGHSSEFTVDFDSKKLTGKLVKNDYVSSVKNHKGGTQTITERYTIDATLHGNRFVGKATAKKPDDPLFGKNSSSLEGGFFGDKAEELAGKFMADDNSLFAVFGAKQQGQIADTNKAFDAQQIHIGDDLKSTKKDVNTFGNATQLVIDGKVFSLLPTSENHKDGKDGKDMLPLLSYDVGDNKALKITSCCSNLDYLKFGQYFYAVNGQNNKDYNYFLTGERTSVADMSKQTGNAKYKGTWAGVLIDSSKQHRLNVDAGNSKTASRAEFDVDFGKKDITGKLFNANGVEPVFNITAKIDGNGFTGTANTHTGGIPTDTGSTNAPSVNISSAVVNGGFYGPNAQELGGSIHQNNDSQDNTAVVFGAKRQQ